MATRVVPARPSLEQYRKQAKDLLRGLAAAAPDAVQRFRLHHPRARALTDLAIREAGRKLADAQLVLAREHGFNSWLSFREHVSKRAAALPDEFSERIVVRGAELAVEITGCNDALGLVLFVLAGNVGRHHPGIRQIAETFNRASFCTALADLLTEDEEVEDAIHEELRFDLPLLSERTRGITDWLAGQPRLAALRMGYFGSGTGAAAGVVAATERTTTVRALVCSAGRPDLAGPWIGRVQAPMLMIVGSEDTVGYGFTRSVMTVAQKGVRNELATVDGAGSRFEAGPAAAQAAAIASDWFLQHLAQP